MAEEVSCPYCGHANQADALFCHACSRVLEDPEALIDQQRKTYLDQKDALVTETTAYLYGKTYPIAEIQEVEIIEKVKDRKIWGLGLLLFGVGTIIEGLFDRDLAFGMVCGLPSILFGGFLVLVTNPKNEEMVSSLWITTEDGTEKSFLIEDEAAAQAIQEAIQLSCRDQRENRKS